jgi:hypothetical protein
MRLDKNLDARYQALSVNHLPVASISARFDGIPVGDFDG